VEAGVLRVAREISGEDILSPKHAKVVEEVFENIGSTFNQLPEYLEHFENLQEREGYIEEEEDLFVPHLWEQSQDREGVEH